jgi:MYXO-CTERM domain-containing protein
METRYPLASWLIVGLLVLAMPQSGQATVVFDQGFDPTGNANLYAGFGGLNTNQYRAQTFQVGITGTLSEVDVYLIRQGSATGGNLVFEIRKQTSAGVPSNVPTDTLVQISIPSTSVSSTPGFLKIDTSAANVQVNTGDALSVVLHASPGTPSSVAYIWYGQTNNPYANGGQFEQVVGNFTWANDGLPNADLGFETFVASAPEPGSFSLGLLGALGLAGYWGRRRAKASAVAQHCTESES